MTMTCREAAAFVEPYVDGELNVTDTTVLNSHIAFCKDCTRLVERQRAWTRVMRQATPRFRAPESLERRVRATVAQAQSQSLEPALNAAASESSTLTLAAAPAPIARLTPKATSAPAPAVARTGTLTRSPWLSSLATAAVLMLCASTAWFVWRAQSNGATAASAATDLVARDVIASHIRSLMADHLTDVPSSDRHTVKPWFAGKLPYALSVPDLTADGFTLEGGRLDYIAGHPVAALVYRRRQHAINLFVWPLTPEARADTDARGRDGYEAIAWTAHSQQHWAVSDVNEAELKLFVQLFQQHE